MSTEAENLKLELERSGWTDVQIGQDRMYAFGEAVSPEGYFRRSMISIGGQAGKAMNLLTEELRKWPARAC